MRRMWAIGTLAGTLALLGGSQAGIAATETSVDCGAGADLQAAISAASPGTILDVSGTCIGVFTIGKHLVLRGRPTATLDGQGQGTTLTITHGGVRVSWITITGGSGGGIANSGNLTLSHVTVTRNQGRGIGGIVSAIGSLTVDHSTVTANTSTSGSVGGISSGVTGTITIRSSTISDNIGMGIFNGVPGTGTNSVTVTDSTVSGNVSTTGVGGIQNDASMTIVRSTIANNTTQRAATPGGIYNSGTLTITSSTISANVGNHYPGGLVDASGHPATIAGTVLGRNVDSFGKQWDCGGPLTSNGYNLIGTVSIPNGTFVNVPCVTTLDQTDHAGTTTPINPLLLPLGNHGGPMQTMPPRTTSSAVDAIPLDAVGADGATGLCPSSGSTDQRGRPRPNGSACDVGSVEK